MGKDDIVLQKQALLQQRVEAEAKKLKADEERVEAEAKKRKADEERVEAEAKKRKADEELADINAQLVAIEKIIEEKRALEEQQEALRHGPAQGMDLVKKVAELSLQAEN